MRRIYCHRSISFTYFWTVKCTPTRRMLSRCTHSDTLIMQRDEMHFQTVFQRFFTLYKHDTKYINHSVFLHTWKPMGQCKHVCVVAVVRSAVGDLLYKCVFLSKTRSIKWKFISGWISHFYFEVSVSESERRSCHFVQFWN